MDYHFCCLFTLFFFFCTHAAFNDMPRSLPETWKLFLSISFTSRCSCSLWSVASISLNRYVIICHRMVYPRLYNKRTVPFIIMGIWIVCFFVDLPNLIGWGRHGFDERIQLCTYDFTYSYSYTFFFIGIGFGVPVCVSIFSYVSILKFSSQSNKVLVRMSVGTTSYNTSVATKKQIHADRRLLKSVLIILVVFIIMWTPHSVMVLGDYYARWPRILHVIGLALAHANSSINSFIYAAYNKDFRRGYIYFMRFIFYRVIFCFSKRGAAIKPMPDDFTQTVGDSTQVVTVS